MAVPPPRADQYEPPTLTRCDVDSLGWPVADIAEGMRSVVPADMLHRLIWVSPQDALADGWRVDSDAEQDTTRDLDVALDVEEVLEDAYGFARAGHGDHGGAYVWVVTDDASFKEELGEGPHEIKALHALALDEVTPMAWGTDPRDRATFGRPTLYQVSMARGGHSWHGQRVHASRLIYVSSGLKKIPSEMQSGTGSRDWSVRHLYTESVRDLRIGFQGAARLIDRRSIPHLGIAKTGPAELVAQYAKNFLRSLTGRGLAVTQGDDTFSFTAPSVSGTTELLTALAWRLCMVESMSLTELFGQPPGGLSTDDEASRRMRVQRIGRSQKNILSPVLLRLYDVALGPDPSRRIVWPSLDEPSDAESASTSKLLAERDAVLIQSGIITEDEARARHADGEEVRELVLEADEAPVREPVALPPFMAPPVEPDPDAEA